MTDGWMDVIISERSCHILFRVPLQEACNYRPVNACSAIKPSMSPHMLSVMQQVHNRCINLEAMNKTHVVKTMKVFKYMCRRRKNIMSYTHTKT